MTIIASNVADHAGAVDRLRALGAEVRMVPPAETAQTWPAEVLRDARVLFCNRLPANLADMKALAWIQITNVGFEPLVPLNLPARGIRASNARGIYDTTIGEWNLAMMVALARDLRAMIRNQEHGIWDPAVRFQNEVRGRVVGLWGYGGIGRETARLARALGMHVHAYARSGVGPRRDTYCVPGTGDPDGVLPDRVFTAGQEVEFLRDLDFLVLAMPLTRSSRGSIGAAQLRALPRSAFVLNPARGPLIQEEALLQALRQDWIAGAALDTHYYYPMPADHPLWRFPNVILTPHVAGSHFCPNFLPRIWDLFVKNVTRFTTGQPLLNELTAAELNDE